MKNNFFHIFITILNRNNDKYLGIKKQISHYVNHSCEDIVLTPEAQKIFRKVEYGARKYFREFYYRPVFKELESSLIQSINSSQGNILVYLQDEGVWSEFLKFLIKKHNLHHVNFINVQHGFLMKNKYTPKRDKVIKLINSFYQLTFGFPKLGIGPFKGAFSHYLLFHEELIDEVPKSSKAIACPNLINRSFIDNYKNQEKRIESDCKSVLIALQLNVPFGFYSVSFEESLKTLIPIIDSLKNDFKYKIFLRRHPGMDEKYFVELINSIGLSNKIILDTLPLEDSINRSLYIMSFNSTILFEASLINRIPVIIDNKTFDLSHFPIKYNMIDTDLDILGQLEKIFKIKPIENNFNDEIDWPNYIESNL